VADARRDRGLVDTSVVIDLPDVPADTLPTELAVSAVTMAELSAGPHATDDPAERARRQDRLQRAEATFDPIPFGGEAARAYGRVYAAVVATGRKARGRRAMDMMIAATALAENLPLYTSNPSDFEAVAGLVEIMPVASRS
jgi:predicted nucleic acid-binding protein